jgi:hypothetical protein
METGKVEISKDKSSAGSCFCMCETKGGENDDIRVQKPGLQVKALKSPVSGTHSQMNHVRGTTKWDLKLWKRDSRKELYSYCGFPGET